MAPPIPLTPALRKDYDQLFATARLRPDKISSVETLVARMVKPDHWSRYESVSSETTVPAHVVALLHAMESGLDFTAHLYNGDPLTARTVHVPKGLPATGEPPFSWEESACGALGLRRGLPQWKDWSLAGTAYALEGYNGWGYRLRHPEVKSPYLWSATTVYTAGKYVADGSWSATAVSRQCGAMALLSRLMHLGRVRLDVPAPAGLGGNKDATKPPVHSEPAFDGTVLRPGDSGPDVRRVQTRLAALGFREVGVADGLYGDKTAQAVETFQARHTHASGDPLTVDGHVGPKTWQALFALGAVNGSPIPAVGAGHPARGNAAV